MVATRLPSPATPESARKVAPGVTGPSSDPMAAVMRARRLGSASTAMQEAQLEQMRQLQGLEGMEGMEQSIEQMESMQSTGMAMGGAVYTIMFILVAALIFFPNLLLYQFATRLQSSLNGAGDAATLTAGLNAHRRYYKFTGILLIVVLCLYALIFLFAGLGAMMM